MNGLQALELMKQGKIIKRKDTNLIFRIEDDLVKCRLLRNREWMLNYQFNFQDEYEEYTKPKETGWHESEEKRDFFYIDSDGLVEDDSYRHERDYLDEDRFSTKMKAEEIESKQRTLRKLQRFSDKNDGNEINWNDRNQNKYYIVYDHTLSTFYINTYIGTQFPGVVYFISEEVAKQAIELFHGDLLKYCKREEA